MPPGSHAPLTPPVFHVLLALSDGPMHGYAIMQRAEEVSGQTMGPGTIYGSLRRLAEAGWVAESGIEDDDARRGRSFLLTELGRAALADEARRITGLARLDQVRQLVPETP
ncbi:MAG: PadR family transcriptional regulator [Gemmatimonadota bacterium]|nr:PadR family transcriptional regulator [Gemmatimonadota bacterium]MDH3423477.1 PadR family transcriptional regulator [Gemmatimonadota bacterium]